MLRVESGLFFANADHVREAVEEHASEEGVHAVVLDAQTVPFVDVTASRMLDDLEEDMRRAGARLLIAGDIGQVRDVLRTTGARGDLVDVHPTVDAARQAARESG